jgi:hypothetical protein
MNFFRICVNRRDLRASLDSVAALPRCALCSLWLNISPKKQQHVATLYHFVLCAKSLIINSVADVTDLDLFPGKILAPFALCAFALNIQVWSCFPESGSEFVSFAYFVVKI